MNCKIEIVGGSVYVGIYNNGNSLLYQQSDGLGAFIEKMVSGGGHSFGFEYYGDLMSNESIVKMRDISTADLGKEINRRIKYKITED